MLDYVCPAGKIIMMEEIRPSKKFMRTLPWVIAVVCVFFWGISLFYKKQVEPVPDGYLWFFGDSLTSGHKSVEKTDTYPSILGQRWNREILDSSIDGLKMSEAQGMIEAEWSRIKKVKGEYPAAVFVALGANDQLNGVRADETRRSLEAVLREVSEEGCHLFVVKCLVPLRSGGYASMYETTGKNHRAKVSRDIISVFRQHPEGKAEDGIHPSRKGHVVIAEQLHQDFGDYFAPKR
jgi:lysophospholipase L1-like esterase